MIDNFNFCNESTANEIAQQPRANDPTFLFRLNPSSEISLEEQDEEEQEIVEINTPVRAVLSSTYSIFDDSELFPMLISQLESDDNINYLLYEYDDQITRLHIKFNNTERDHEEITYSAGMIITNSEVGLSSIWVEPVVYRNDLIYTNRGTLLKQDVQLKMVHRGEIDRERVTNAFSRSSRIAQVGIVQLIEAFQIKIEPEYALSLIQNIPEFPNRMALILYEEWEHEEDLKKADIATAILQMAQTLPLFQKIKIEQTAGKIIGLFDRYEFRMAQILEEIEEQE
jgi:hypothetical protein